MPLMLLKLINPRLCGLLGAIILVIVCLTVAFHDGERRERAKWTARIAVENAKNAQKSATLATVAATVGTKVEDDQAARTKTVTVYRDRIVAAPMPDCAASQTVMDDINAVRADPRVQP